MWRVACGGVAVWRCGVVALWCSVVLCCAPGGGGRRKLWLVGGA